MRYQLIALSFIFACALGLTSANPVGLDSDAELLDRYSPYQQQRNNRQFPITLDLSPLLDSVFSSINKQIGSSINAISRPAVKDCDKAYFDLPPRDYRIVTDCQLTQRDNEGVTNCILSGELSQKSKEFRSFLTEKEDGDVEIKSAIKSVIKDGRAATVLNVEVSKCLGEKIDRFESYEGGFDEPSEIVPVDNDSSQSYISTSVSSTGNAFNFPSIDRLFNSMFPTTSDGGSIFSQDPFSQFPSFILPKTTYPNVDMNNCATKRFNLTVEDFDTVRYCYNNPDVTKCLGGSDMSNRNLVEFATDENHALVGHTFSSYTAWVGGEFSRNHMVRLQRCEKRSEQPDVVKEQEQGLVGDVQDQELVGTDTFPAVDSPIEQQQQAGESLGYQEP